MGRTWNSSLIERSNKLEEIIFNDADGTDKDTIHYEYGLIYSEECNFWGAPNFFVESSEYGSGIVYDSLKDNIRYCVVFSVRGDSRLHDVTIFTGTSFKTDAVPEYQHDDKLEMKESNLSFRNFLSFDENGKIDSSSKEKFIKLVQRFMNLKVFI